MGLRKYDPKPEKPKRDWWDRIVAFVKIIAAIEVGTLSVDIVIAAGVVFGGVFWALVLWILGF